MLKKMVHSCKDGAGGPGISTGEIKPVSTKATISARDNAVIAPFKNAYYKRVVAAAGLDKILKMTGLRKKKGKLAKSLKEALKHLKEG